MTSRAEVSVRTAHADVVAKALSVESADRVPRTKVSVERVGEDEVRLRVEAEDVSALRAALNSYIRWMNVAEETAKEARST